MTRSDAVDAAREALGELRVFTATVGVTTREFATLDVEATDIHHAGRKVRRMVGEVEFTTNFSNDIEGDESATVVDYETQDELDVDCRLLGEPFSWVACGIVKELAKAGPGDDLTALLVRARAACLPPKEITGEDDE